MLNILRKHYLTHRCWHGRRLLNYTPLVKIGKDDNIFGGDLLHVIGLQARDFDKLSHYYAEHGIERQLAMQLLLAADEKKNKGEFLDSLMRVYGDYQYVVKWR